MMPAVIDIGTNSVLLLIAQADKDKKITVIEDRIAITRLGEELSKNGYILDAASKRTIAAIADYMELCRQHGAGDIILIGTAALRQASNSQDFLKLIKDKFEKDVEIISGEREASLSFTAQTHDFGDNLVVLDIGGGSTEIITRTKDGLDFASIPMGAVSLTEKFLASDPVKDSEVLELRQHVRREIEAHFDPSLFARIHDKTFVATAGTATTLASMKLQLPTYDAAKVHGSILKIDELRNLIDILQSKKIEERKNIAGLLPARADVILAGAYVLHEMMSVLGYAQATISDRGIKWGVLYEKIGS